MINKHFCSEDISLIENYEKAKADDFKGWDLHHRLETDHDCFRPTRQQLKNNGLYYDRPASELIFMKHVDHARLHMKKDYEVRQGVFSEYAQKKSSEGKHMSEEHRKKLSDAWSYDKHFTKETRRKMSEAQKGKKYSEESKKKISEALKGRSLSEEHRKKIAEAIKGKHWKLVDGKRVWY